MYKKRIIHVHGGMNKGGTESVIMNIYRNIDREKFDFDFTKMVEEECAYDQEIKKMGGQFKYIEARNKVGILKHCSQLYKLFRDEQYDIIHSHMNFHGGIVAFIAKIAGCKKIICHAHNTSDGTLNLKKKIEIKLLKSMMKIFATDLLACGQEAGNFVFGSDKFTVLNNGVDLNKFKMYEKDKILELKEKNGLKNEIILGHIGRFSEQKNHKFILKIIEELQEKNVDFKFIFIGEGEEEKEFVEEIKKMNLENKVEILGLRDDINDWLNIFDMLIFPSLYEGLSVVLVEAQASGLHCMVSDKITLESDMGLDLFTTIGIEKKMQSLWVEKILNYEKNEKINNIKISDTLKKAGYSVNGVIDKITKIYMGEV